MTIGREETIASLVGIMLDLPRMRTVIEVGSDGEAVQDGDSTRLVIWPFASRVRMSCPGWTWS
jgi:hypothetical protein